MRLHQVATLATRPAKSHASLQELTEGWRERADRHVPRALQAAWVTSLAGRNDLPLLTSDDLGEAILADAARAVLATGRGGRPGCRPARPGRTLGRRCHQQTPGWCRPHRRAHPPSAGRRRRRPGPSAGGTRPGHGAPGPGTGRTGGGRGAGLGQSLGPAPVEAGRRDAWLQAVSTVAAFRDRWELGPDPRPLGLESAVTTLEGLGHRRGAQAAVARALKLANATAPPSARSVADPKAYATRFTNLPGT